ncbi:hypothetical protein SASPL_105232 [Salvia splendens]|uniref:Dirigent protein n=1 Tax=Salvia splendens TaxID=180675 RepID=A0A8X9A950_SALSN|nr:hypothetical protein SASPL_105232 [Salvia splendens]
MTRKLMLFHMLTALSILADRLEAGAKFPIVHFIDAMSRPIDLHIRSGGAVELGSATAGPGLRDETESGRPDRLEAGAKFPIVHFIDAMSRPIDLHIRSGGLSSSAQLQPAQDYGMRLKVDNVHSVMSVSGSSFASFNTCTSRPAIKGAPPCFGELATKGFT